MANQDLISTFYQAFAKSDAEAMVACYHDEVVFQDPAFGQLHGESAKNMWRMLLGRAGTSLEISFDNVELGGHGGSANWIAKYPYGPKKRPVINRIQAQFEFKDGKIFRHTDHFDLWKWAQQALGVPGLLLGWSGFMRGKVQQTAKAQLKAYEEKKAK